MNRDEERWERSRRRQRRLDRWGLLAEPDFVIPLVLMLGVPVAVLIVGYFLWWRS